MEYDTATKNEDTLYVHMLKELQDILLSERKLRCRKLGNKRGKNTYTR